MQLEPLLSCAGSCGTKYDNQPAAAMVDADSWIMINQVHGF